MGRQKAMANLLFPGIARGQMEVSHQSITVTSSHSMKMIDIMPYIRS